jgi:beta-galactosidase
MRDSEGPLSLAAHSPGLRGAAAMIRVRPAAVRHALPPSLQQTVLSWRQSPVLRERPAVIPDIADSDMNSWETVIAGESPAAAAGNGFVLLAARIKLGEAMAKGGATLKFAGITGRGDVLVDGAVAARKADPTTGPLELRIPAGRGEIAVTLVMDAVAGAPVGLTGPVFIEALPGR